ncbi:hypothetical protein GCM10011385_07630 [Nitratireductor aestuarii]|uniref:AlpA family transcriptional regulator n=1 Tax=Nitratireductor aestuarii TaxID=1735103 RepID=A0A916RHQ5_9HYPH|nr:AlpA family transcriptional regulator [Nitratireductor aestuarii]GGA56602.1 hypothetical protein GCM10011385_07630 [Nitratireductor aestuarii]
MLYAAQTPERLIRLPEVMARTGLGRTFIYRLVAKGLFPKPIKLGARASAWLENEIDGWIIARAAERNSA